MSIPNRIILAGFMGTGKSSVGRILAKRLGYTFADTDQLIEARAGRSISQIFSEWGEETFRQWEAEAIEQSLRPERTVLAVGGGAVCFKKNFQRLKRNGRVILLTAEPETILQRIRGESHRPLLEASNREEKLRELWEERRRHYSKIETQIATDRKSVDAVAREIIDMLSSEEESLTVRLGPNSYPLYFEQGGFGRFPELLKKHSASDKLVVVTDRNVHRLWGKKFLRGLKEFKVHSSILPAGEKTKNLATMKSLYAELIRAKADRKTTLVALGGGVIGDLGGFAAATFLRGIPFIQVPTTLLAQVDSSIGGKTGVDLPEGKNLVGAFYQPKFVYIDEAVLSTLPPREFVCGMAEVIKYAAIFDARLFKTLEEQLPDLLARRGEGMGPIIRSCCEWKAWVVEKDEKETKGLRSKLNFGHTLGHAIESLTRYSKFTHGEAIAMGMVFAAEKSVKKCGFPVAQLERLKKLLGQAGLPTVMPAFGKRPYLKALSQDKKRVSSQVHFVYLEKIGKAAVIPTPLSEIL